MKRLLITLGCVTALSLSAGAVTFDTDGFGASLNGWRKNRTALYSIDAHSYRTHAPTITPTAAGGMFVSTRVDHCPTGRKATSSYIELTFSREGQLLTGQIRVQLGDSRLNTGQVTLDPVATPPAEEDGSVVDPEPWKTPTTQVVMDLFDALDTELGKLSAKDAEGKKDVFGRIFGNDFGTADLAAALRHNLNLMLQYVR